MNKLTQQDCRFVYYHHFGAVVTVAYRILNYGEKSGVHNVAFGYATCSPKDKFVKKSGRQVAIDRLNERLDKVVTIPDDPNAGLYRQVSNCLEDLMFNRGEYQKPHWMKRSVTIASLPLCEAFECADALSKEDRNWLRKYLNSSK